MVAPVTTDDCLRLNGFHMMARGELTHAQKHNAHTSQALGDI